MNLIRASILALFLGSSYFPTAIAGESVMIAAKETEATVAPRAARLKLVNLPALEFSLRATIKCVGEAESLTFSIADTYKTLATDAITGRRSAEMALSVPARQLALAASSTFCLRGDPAGTDELLVPGFATAHASLRCRNEDGVTVHFASAPLQVRLSCQRPSTENQDPSPDR
jgi:hypothetical protein